MDLNGTDRCLECMRDKSGSAVCPHCGWDEARTQRPPIYLACGTLLNDQYVVGKVLGHGGFGVTYLAWDTRLNTRVAIKEYLPRDFGTRNADGLSVSCFQGEAVEMFDYGRRKFLDEARNLARFSEHPSIVSVLGYFEVNATAYMVMQYVDGMDLKEYLAQKGGRLAVDVALRVTAAVLDALRAVHDTGLLHRDMSPDNIYVTQTQRIMILDFGAARDAVGSHSRSLALIRKPGYSPEEQYRGGGEQGPWTDVYAAAATFYRLITGEIPPEALDRLADDRLQAPSALGVVIEPRREAALLKALAVRAADRYQTVAEFQDALIGDNPESESRRSSLLWWIPALLLGGAAFAWAAMSYLQIQELGQEKRLQEAMEEAKRQTKLLNQERLGRQREETARLQAEEDARQAATEQAKREAERQAEAKQARQRAEAEEERLKTERRAAEQAKRRAAAEKAKRDAESRAEAERDRLKAERRAAEQAKRRAVAEKAKHDAERFAAASRCQDGYLNATQIRALVTGRTAFGERIGISTSYRWKEYQGSSGMAYFQRDGKSYSTGKWTLRGDTICWCYGSCQEYSCKRVRATGDCTQWYYEETDTGKATGRVNHWETGDKTG